MQKNPCLKSRFFSQKIVSKKGFKQDFKHPFFPTDFWRLEDLLRHDTVVERAQDFLPD